MRIFREFRDWNREPSRKLVFVICVWALSVAGCDSESSSSTAELNRERAALVTQLEKRGIEDQRVLAALAAVPRHEFIPDAHRSRSYEDVDLPIGDGQTTFRPSRIARVLEALELKGGESVLEVGTGSGFQAALLTHLVDRVVTMEIREPLKRAAKEKLSRLNEAGVIDAKKVEFIVGDGSKGYPKGGPYDCILVSAASSELPKELLAQLKEGGRLVIPVGQRIQELEIVHKGPGGQVRRESIEPVRVPHLEE
ncbi:MAG: protein-L-isoaspartate(D-aspartate) O-methyltransferase [Planctomycetota bacterium]